MVIVMHQSASTEAALGYNESKVEKGKASFFHHKNTNTEIPFCFSKGFRMDTLCKIESSNTRVKNKCFHLSFNPGPGDLEKIGIKNLRIEMDRLMKQMGYGDQPYFVYHHKDIDGEHFHLVSTRIDVHSFRKIKDNNEKRRINAFVKDLEQRYQLNHSSHIRPTEIPLTDDRSPELYNSIQNTFNLLNQSSLSGRQQYLDVLRGFNIQIRETVDGHSVFVVDQNGHPQRYPIALSEFREQPNFWGGTGCKELDPEIMQQLRSAIENLLKGLNKDYRFYTENELRAALFMHNMIMFKDSKNNNLNVYSIKEKAVIDAQFLLKKYRARLKDLVLTSDEFYALAKDCGMHLFNAESPFIYNKPLDTAEIEVLKAQINNLDLHQVEGFQTLAADWDEKKVKTVQEAVKSYLIFMLDSMAKKSLNAGVQESTSGQPGYLERVKNRFLWEVMKEWAKGNKVSERKDKGQKKRSRRRFRR